MDIDIFQESMIAEEFSEMPWEIVRLFSGDTIMVPTQAMLILYHEQHLRIS